MEKTPKDYAKMLIKELRKHAQKDDCYNCKELLRAMGLNPDE